MDALYTTGRSNSSDHLKKNHSIVLLFYIFQGPQIYVPYVIELSSLVTKMYTSESLSIVLQSDLLV